MPLDRLVGPLLTTLLLCSCGGPPPVVETETVPGASRRIAVMAPSAAEMLVALDAETEIVGIGDYVTAPASVTALPQIGAYNAPNVERVVELRADLYLSTASQAATPAHRHLETLGIEVVAFDTSTFEGVFASLAELGRVLDRETRANAVASEMRERLDEIRRAAEGLPRPKVLFVVGLIY